jgi:hypothetical protein
MGLINSIGAYFNKFLGGWTFGTQTDQLTVKNSAEIVGTTGVIYEHTFQNKNGIVAHLDDITISLPTDTTGSILFLNALNDFDSDGTYFNWDKVNKRLNLKGNSDTVGNIFVAQNLSNNEIFRLQNDRDVVIGGGSASTNTQVTINPFRTAGTSNYVFQANAQGTNNFVRFVNSDTNTDGGLQIGRNVYGSRTALTILGGGVVGFSIDSNGQLTFGTSHAGGISLFNPQITRNSTNAAVYHSQVGSEGKFLFENVSAGSYNSSKGMFIIRKNLTEASVSTITHHMFEIDGTFNLTNGSKNIIGINYNPTITALSGAHYGFLIRPATFNGIGLGATLPTATFHVNSPNTVNSLKVDVGTVDSALLVNSAGEVTTRKFTWTIDLMLFTTIDLVADVNFKIVSVTNIKNSPTTTIQVNASPYTLGTNITLGDTINVQVSTLSVVRLNCELI